MITFEEAQAIVAANRSSEYPPEAEFQVATWGWENDDEYLVGSGPYVMLYGPRNPDDMRFLYVDDAPATTVNKHTGEYLEHYGLLGEFPFPDMVPFGESPE